MVVTIDNVNIQTAYGALPCRGTRAALIAPAPAKAYIKSNIRTESGIRYRGGHKDGEQTYQLSFVIDNTQQKIESFFSAIKGKHTWKFTQGDVFSKELSLVYSSCVEIGGYSGNIAKFAIEFIAPNA